MDERSKPRAQFECPIAFSGDDIVGEGTLVNLSASGWKVRCDRQVPKGTYLSLRISLPDKESPMEVTLAVVRWATGEEFGLEFLRMGTEEQTRLRQFATTLDSAPDPENTKKS